MQNVGTVISVDLDTSIKGQKGIYPGWQLVYRSDENEVKTISKHENTLKHTKGLRESLEALKMGDVITIHQEKQGDFWNITSIEKGGQVKNELTMQAKQFVPEAKPSGGNTYPTKEERAQTQKYIVRQSAINQALEYSKSVKQLKTMADVIDIARQFEAYVYGESDINDMADDVPV